MRHYILFAKSAVSTLVKFSTETLLHLHVELLTQWLKLYLVDDLSHECVLQEGARFLLADASLTHIEESSLVHNAYC